MSEPDVPEDIAKERAEIVERVEAEQEEIRQDLAPASQDPSTRRGITAKTRQTLVIAGVIGGVVVGVICALVSRNVGITVAGAAVGAVLAAVLSTLLLLEKEDGRIDEDVHERGASKERPPT